MPQKSRAAIVLALFGLASESGVPGLLGLERSLKNAFPHTPLTLAFSSKTIRQIWQKRGRDSAFRASRPAYYDLFYNAAGPQEAVRAFCAGGYENIVVQAAYIAPAGEFQALKKVVAACAALAERRQTRLHLALGRPALGDGAGFCHDREADGEKAAHALMADIAQARRENAALLYMGHGSPHFPVDRYYEDLARRMRRLAPDVPVFACTLADEAGLNAIMAELARQQKKRLVLKPLLLCAGLHVIRDMTSGAASWQSRLSAAGFTVNAVPYGLGAQPEFARIFACHAAEAAQKAGFTLC